MVLYAINKNRSSSAFLHRENPLKLEIKHLIDCATEGAIRVVSVDEELRSLQVALQVLEILDKDGLV